MKKDTDAKGKFKQLGKGVTKELKKNKFGTKPPDYEKIIRQNP